MQDTFFPWLAPYWHKLQAYNRQQNFPNALLIVGEQGHGFETLVQSFANSIYCEHLQNDGTACGRCDACQMFNSGTYPDYTHVKPEEDETKIKIEAIRRLIQWLSLTPQFNKQRLVLISPVDNLVYQASNSLLKTLEEPNEGTTLILIAHQLENVPATIRSRCQLVTNYSSDEDEKIQWLEEQGCEQARVYFNLANGSPLLAKELWSKNAIAARNEVFEMFVNVVNQQLDPLLFSARCIKLKTYPFRSWICTWLSDAIVLSSTRSTYGLKNSDLADHLKVVANKLHLKQLYALFDEALEMSRLESGQVNQQLLLDKFAINCFSKFN